MNGKSTASASKGALQASPAAGIRFGNISVGQSSSTTVSLLNSGTSPVKISKMSTSGQPFSIDSQIATPVTVDPGATYQISVRFSPSAAGAASGQLTVVSSASTLPLALNGTGTAATASVPDLTLGATNVALGNVALNSSATQTVTLTSSGTATLTINAGSVTGTGFSLGGMGFPATLNPGQTATLQIQFTPTVAGNASGAVVLTSGAASGQTATIALSGTGQVVTYEVALGWSPPAAPAERVAGYNVYRAIGGSPSYQLLNSSVDATTFFTDITVQNGTSYSYYVASVDADGNQSAPSNTYSVDIP